MSVIYLLGLVLVSSAVVVHEVLLLLAGGGSAPGWMVIVPVAGTILCAFLVLATVYQIRHPNGAAAQITGWQSELIAFMLTWVTYFGLIVLIMLLVGLLPFPIIYFYKHGELSFLALAGLAEKLGRASVLCSLVPAVVMYAAAKFGWLNRDA